MVSLISLTVITLTLDTVFKQKNRQSHTLPFFVSDYLSLHSGKGNHLGIMKLAGHPETLKKSQWAPRASGSTLRTTQEQKTAGGISYEIHQFKYLVHSPVQPQIQIFFPLTRKLFHTVCVYVVCKMPQ